MCILFVDGIKTVQGFSFNLSIRQMSDHSNRSVQIPCKKPFDFQDTHTFSLAHSKDCTSQRRQCACPCQATTTPKNHWPLVLIQGVATNSLLVNKPAGPAPTARHRPTQNCSQETYLAPSCIWLQISMFAAYTSKRVQCGKGFLICPVSFGLNTRGKTVKGRGDITATTDCMTAATNEHSHATKMTAWTWSITDGQTPK